MPESRYKCAPRTAMANMASLPRTGKWGVMGRHCGTALIVDADKVSRDLVVELFGRAGFDCVTAKRGDEALMAVRGSKPWLVVSEVRLPDISGYELCRELRDEFGEDIAIVFVSADRTEPMDRAAGLLVGADDYIVKPFDPSELLARIRRLSERAGRSDGQLRNGRARIDRLTESLTARERETLILLALGRRPREIAAQLSIGEKTVASHLQRVLEKLGVHSRSHAVAIAYRDGLFDDEEADALLEARAVRALKPVG
jgi:DNA-binding NarL/FixJ family response regulator